MNSPVAQFLRPAVDRKVYNIVQLIHRAMNYEGYSKDYGFHRAGIAEHLVAPVTTMPDASLRHPPRFRSRPSNHESVFTFDLAVDGRE